MAVQLVWIQDTVSDIFETILKPVEQPDLQFD